MATKRIPQTPTEDSTSSGPPNPPSGPPPSASRSRARRAGVVMEDRDPEIGTVGPQGPPAPKIQPEPPFWFVYNPERWCVMEGQVIPLLYKLSARPGARGVGMDEEGRPVMGEALANIQIKGHTIIPWDVDGPGTRYLRREPTAGGWLSRWETPFPGSSIVRVDEEGYARWVRSLCERGVLGLPPIYILEELREQLVERIARNEQEGKDSYRVSIERDRSSLEAVERELAEALEEERGALPGGDPDDPGSEVVV